MAIESDSDTINDDQLEVQLDTSDKSPLEQIASEDEDSAYSPSHYEIITIPADFTLEGLAAKWRKNQLTIPGFQRKYVWTQRQASRLIESFLLGLPVPSLFLYTDPDTGEQQVIDGQQRLTSVVQFFDGEFKNAKMSKPKKFTLLGLGDESDFEGLTVSDLESSFPAKYAKLCDAVMRAFVIKQLDPDDATSIYHIFERLNTGGSTLQGQEIRNCVYHGTLNDLINELNTHANWRDIIGKAALDARMRDVEMVLRFVSLYFYGDQYKKPMKDFLSSSMKKLRNIDAAKASKLKVVFEQACKVIVHELGVRPFHISRGMNPAVFDSVFTTIARGIDRIPPDLKSRYEKLVASDEYKSSSSYRTTDVDAVNSRLALAKVLVQ